MGVLRFPLTLTLSPMGEREMEWNTLRVISDQFRGRAAFPWS